MPMSTYAEDLLKRWEQKPVEEAEGKKKYWMNDIAEKLLWVPSLVSMIAHEAGIDTIRKGIRYSGEAEERYFNGKEYRRIEKFRNTTPERQNRKSLWAEYYGVPAHIRIT